MKTILELFEKSVSQFADHIFLWEKKDGRFQGTSYLQVRNEVYHFTAGLISLGIRKGDRIGLLSEGRNRWIISELGILYAGAINVPISVNLHNTQELKFRLEHSGSRMVIVSKGHAGKIEAIRNEIPDLEKVIYLDPKENRGEHDLDYLQVLALGEKYLATNRPDFESIRQNIGPGDIANISYTSGTTADPKGIMLSHLNYASNVIQANTLMEIDSGWKTLAFLPWDHAFAHTACLYCFMINGAGVASLELGQTSMETLKNIPKNILEIKPDMLMSVPAIARNFRKNIEAGIRKKGYLTIKLFSLGLKLAYLYNSFGYDRGKGLRILIKPIYLLFDIMLFRKIRKAFGGKLKLFIGGGALLDIELQRFFYAIGIPMCQGYGLSEASPVISSNALHAIKFGSSGKLVKYMDLKIVDTDGIELPAGTPGEIIVKGDNVMKGYWNNPAATAESVRDGWLFTGDMGYLDPDGYLFVLGRYKSLLIGNDGEKFSPEGIEEALVNHSRYIDQCMLYNNQNIYTSGLVVPNIPSINDALGKRGLIPGSKEGLKEALNIIQQEVDEYKPGGKFENLFPDRWLPAAIAILPEGFTDQNQLINTTLKMVRGKIAEHFREQINYLNSPEAKNIQNPGNLEAMKKWNG